MLNHGHRKGANVWRCVGEESVPTSFDVYGPKAFASIGGVPETVASRSIRIRMQKKSDKDKVERLRIKTARTSAEPIRTEITEWVKANAPQVEKEYDQMKDLEFVSAREADIWEPLFSICKILAPDRIPELETCAKKLCNVKKSEESDEDAGTELIAFLRDSFWPTSSLPLAPTQTIVDFILQDPDSPWFEERVVTGRWVAKMFRPFGIRPRKMRAGKDTFRGYDEDEFKAAYRYLPEHEEQVEQAA